MAQVICMYADYYHGYHGFDRFGHAERKPFPMRVRQGAFLFVEGQ